MSKKSNLTVTLIGAGIVLLALIFVLSAVFAPRTEAKKALREVRRVLTETETFSYVTVFNPLDHSGSLLPTESEARLTESAEIDALRDRLLAHADGARYDRVKEAVGGNWDIRVRFAAEGETADLYLSEDSFYLSREGRQYIFVPRDAEAYTAWRAEWLKALFGAAE